MHNAYIGRHLRWTKITRKASDAAENLQLYRVVRFFHPRSSCTTTHMLADVQRITLNASCMTISGGRTKQLDIFCHVTGFTSDFLSFMFWNLIGSFMEPFNYDNHCHVCQLLVLSADHSCLRISHMLQENVPLHTWQALDINHCGSLASMTDSQLLDSFPTSCMRVIGGVCMASLPRNFSSAPRKRPISHVHGMSESSSGTTRC